MRSTNWLWMFALLGCGNGGSQDNNTPSHDASIDSKPVAIDAAPRCPHPRTVYLNRMGGTYAPGSDDSRTNKSSVLDMERALAGTTISDATWDTVKSCVTAELARFDAIVTEVDPGSAAHHEIVFTTKYWVTGQENQLSSLSSASCTPGDAANGVVFVFADLFGNTDPQGMCDGALAQLGLEIANLDWDLDCHDVQSVFLNPCGTRMYRDMDMKCGEYQARDCRCGGSTQNSFQSMKSAMCD